MTTIDISAVNPATELLLSNESNSDNAAPETFTGRTHLIELVPPPTIGRGTGYSLCKRTARAMLLAVLGLALIGVNSAHNAQAAVATDNELYAGYCKGVMTLLDQKLDAVREASKRFSEYLLATGALTDPARQSEALGISSALARGQTDQRSCDLTLRTCSDMILGGRGTPVPNDNRTPHLMACIDQNPSCSRAMRCLGPDNLPF